MVDVDAAKRSIHLKMKNRNIKLAIIGTLVIGVLVGCSSSNAVADEKQYLNLVGITRENKFTIIRTYEDVEHNKIIYTVSDEDGVSIAVTDR